MYKRVVICLILLFSRDFLEFVGEKLVSEMRNSITSIKSMKYEVVYEV